MVDYLISTGGTGGHVFPAIALAKKLDNCAIVTDKRSTLYLNGSDVITDYIDICSPKSKIRFLFSFFRSVFQSFKLVKKYRPKKVICFGGYATLPILFISVLQPRSVICVTYVHSRALSERSLIHKHTPYHICNFAEIDKFIKINIIVY